VKAAGWKDALADLVVVHALGQGGDDGGAHAGALQVVQRLFLGGSLVAVAPQRAQCGIAERVELQAHVHAAARQLLAEGVVAGDAQAVRGNGDA
jgi:hypothetical protein